MVTVKPPNFFEKGKLAHLLAPITCNMCGAKRLVHMYSHCWSHKECNICANRNFKDSDIFRGE